MRRIQRLAACVMAVVIGASISVTAAAAPPTIFAAASLQPALDQMARDGVLGSPAPRLVYAASSALARQIEDGAPADIFISADERQIVIKTTAARVRDLENRIKQLHPYEVPEILVVPVVGGSASYLAWVQKQTSPA